MTDLVLVTRTVNDGATGNQFSRREVTVRSGETGRTRAGVAIDLYRFDYQRGHARVSTQTTNRFGVATFDHPAGNSRSGHRYFALARQRDANEAIDVALDPNYYHFQRKQRLHEVTSTLLYTDRSIYRPNQTLYFKVVAYSGKQPQGDYQVRAGTDLLVELVDANGEVVSSKTLETNSFGSASDEFQIESGRLLGSWSLRATVADSRQSYSNVRIQVEEYKRPTFEVTVDDPTRALRLKPPSRAHRQRCLLLRPAGGERQCQLAGHPRTGLSLVVVLVRPPHRQHSAGGSGRCCSRRSGAVHGQLRSRSRRADR